MDVRKSQSEGATPELVGITKAVTELEILISALLTSLPSAKPWQRQIRVHLGEADRLLQVLRLVKAMKRDPQEHWQASDDLLAAMRVMDTYVRSSRADHGTRLTVQLGCSLAQRVSAGIRL